MVFWNYYFIAKIYLWFKGVIHMGFFVNLLFMLFLIIPLPREIKYYKPLITIKYVLSVPIGIILLWRDSWLPPFFEAITSLNHQGWPSNEYIFLFIVGSLKSPVAIILLLILISSIVASRFVKLTPIVTALILILPLSEIGQSTEETERYLESFYRSESGRLVRFGDFKEEGADFDIIILHICSLSWDDLESAGMGRDIPFFRQFDLLWTNFNSVTSHSNPSAIRLLRANCGQPRHGGLYNNVSDECYLFESLRENGYKTYMSLNHDGKYGHFLDEITTLGRPGNVLLPSDIPIQSYNFDDTAIFDDYLTLERMWMIRQEMNAGRTAVYYNSISLHEGAHLPDEKDWWRADSRKGSYREFSTKLFKDITRFMDLVSASGRSAVVIFIPEHGAALGGSIIQPAGLREIPLPQITRVPVGIKFINKDREEFKGKTMIVSKPVSYLSVSYLLSSLLRENPFREGTYPLEGLIDNIPETPFVSENEKAGVIGMGNDYYLRDRQKGWLLLPANSIHP